MRTYRVVRAGGHLAAGAALVFLTSCGSGRPTTYPTKGQVLVNGSPAEGVDVAFVVTGEEPAKRTEGESIPHAITGANGKFELSTFGKDDGAPAGDYKVALTWPAWKGPPQPAPDRLLGAYTASAKAPIHAHVDAKATTLPPFELNNVKVLSEKEVEEAKKLTKHELYKKSRRGK